MAFTHDHVWGEPEHEAIKLLPKIPGVIEVILPTDPPFVLGPGQFYDFDTAAFVNDEAIDPGYRMPGLILHGETRIAGTPKATNAEAVGPILAGAIEIEFADPIDGWRVGDELFVHGPPDFATGLRYDETVKITSINGQLVGITPCEHTHGNRYRGPDISGITSSSLGRPNGLVDLPRSVGRVTNITKDCGVRGQAGVGNRQRPQFMIMHKQDGSQVTLSDAAFINLGRTRGNVMHTLPQVDQSTGRLIPGTADNPIGQYGGPHQHTRLSPDGYAKPPVRMTRLLTKDAVGHGYVNHGGFQICDSCAAINVLKSSYFTENRSEIGAWLNCWASASDGEAEHNPNSRAGRLPIPPERLPTPEDNGFAAYGFWAQSGGHVSVGCKALGTKVGFEFMPFDMYDATEWSVPDGMFAFAEFLRANLIPPEEFRFGRPLEPLYKLAMHLDTTPQMIGGPPTNYYDGKYFAGLLMPWHCEDFVAEGCFLGGGLWSTFGVVPSTLKHIEFIGCYNGLELHYHRMADIDDLRIVAREPDEYNPSSVGISLNGNTTDINIKNLVMIGQDYGCVVPFHGHNSIDTAYLDNQTFNLVVHAPWGRPWHKQVPPGGSLTMRNVVIGNSVIEDKHKIRLINHCGPTPKLIPGDDTSPIIQRDPDGFELNQLDEDGNFVYPGFFEPFACTFDGRQLIHDCRLPDAVPFSVAEEVFPAHQKYVGLTNRELWSQYGKWVGGAAMWLNQDGTVKDDLTFESHPMVVGGKLLVESTSPPVAIIPTIEAVIEPATIKVGEQSTLTWVSTSAIKVYLDGNETELSGALAFSPLESTTYTLQAVSETGHFATVIVSLTVLPADVIPAVTLDIDKDTITVGETATLTWTSADAVHAWLEMTDQATGDTITVDAPTNGSQVLMPFKVGSFWYSLRVVSSTGNEATSGVVTLDVLPVDPPPTPEWVVDYILPLQVTPAGDAAIQVTGFKRA